jgi:hypothetical protein
MKARVAFSLSSCALAGATPTMAANKAAHIQLVPALLMIRLS